MVFETHFIESLSGKLQKKVECHIPNLHEGDFVIITDDDLIRKQWRWCIKNIETFIKKKDMVLFECDMVIQKVYVTCCGLEENWQHRMNQNQLANNKMAPKRQEKTGVVKADFQVAMDDGSWVDLDPCMQMQPAFAVKPGDKVRIIIENKED